MTLTCYYLAAIEIVSNQNEAHEIVSQARQYRAQKLKAAKADAAADIDVYKKKKEAELKGYEQEHSGSNKAAEEAAEAAVESELKAIKKTAAEKQAAVVKLLLEAVTKPTPELHINAA
ncbi:unnamed protein product [Kuraishia capsulata CBS 1993]|uniref:V-type proton ATPase subunit G n=1 Tax=Kuraishia capsulata CBS 1993 TaxID=1382522 RepID=W6MK61_9ASCO|nr:uncharacterized protein KUCA_T00000954001 [Kuraishia capsulata CBS 1993]CDK24987.1 unnamed protein product [Kuraishia capsulata CBS 1993]